MKLRMTLMSKSYTNCRLLKLNYTLQSLVLVSSKKPAKKHLSIPFLQGIENRKKGNKIPKLKECEAEKARHVARAIEILKKVAPSIHSFIHPFIHQLGEREQKWELL